eukprot:4344150-Alexandrium_andersonii.AAC.1
MASLSAVVVFCLSSRRVCQRTLRCAVPIMFIWVVSERSTQPGVTRARPCSSHHMSPRGPFLCKLLSFRVLVVPRVCHSALRHCAVPCSRPLRRSSSNGEVVWYSTAR